MTLKVKIVLFSTFNSKTTERPKIFLWPFSKFFGPAYSPLNSDACKKISLVTKNAYVSEEILNWHSLSLSLSADICIHFYCPSKSKKNDSKFSPKAKTKTKQVQNLFRYSSLKIPSLLGM